jgi:hypothetical protein
MKGGASQVDEGSARERLLFVVRGGLYLVSIGALLRVLHLLIDNPLTHTVLGAVAVSLIATHAGVRYEVFGARAIRRIAWACALVAVVVGASLAAALAGGATIASVPASVAAIYGVAESIALAYTREMWLRGIPMLMARRAGMPVAATLAFAALAGVAAVALEPGTRPAGLVLTGAAGAFFASLWLRGGDPYAPIVGHVLWVWLCDSALAGELFTVSGLRVTASAGASGLPAWVASAGFCVAAAAVLKNAAPIGAHAAVDFPPEDEKPATPPPAQPPSTEPKAKRKTKRKPRPKTEGET